MRIVHITALPTAGSGTYVNMMQINFCNYNGTQHFFLNSITSVATECFTVFDDWIKT